MFVKDYAFSFVPHGYKARDGLSIGLYKLPLKYIQVPRDREVKLG